MPARRPAGAQRNEALLRLLSDSGMALCGPNCAGIFSLARRHRRDLHPTSPRGSPPAASRSSSQSGGLINALLELGRNRGLGFQLLRSSSAGNEAAVNSADYL